MILSDIAPEFGWRLELDNPTFLGWTVVTFYITAALACGRAAQVAGGQARKEFSMFWSLLATLLMFLGVNKQLNLQTLLIVLGRRAAHTGAWYEHRRLAQAAFSAAFVLAAGVAIYVLANRAKLFFAENPFAWRGLIILVVFVSLRAATINHVNDWFGVELYDDKWCWLLEICGSCLLALSALRFIRSQHRA
jgi:hypothetical protein